MRVIRLPRLVSRGCNPRLTATEEGSADGSARTGHVVHDFAVANSDRKTVRATADDEVASVRFGHATQAVTTLNVDASLTQGLAQ